MKQFFSFLAKNFCLLGKHLNKIGFIAIHIFALAVFFVPFTWLSFWLMVGFYFLGMFGITAGYHRLLSHASYKASRLMKFALAFTGCTALQKGPIWWVRQHRAHHKNTDTSEDPHSPIRPDGNFWHAHIGWMFGKKKENGLPEAKDITKFWEMRLLNRLHFVPALLLACLCWLIDGWSGVVWGFVLRTVILYHATFAVNSICHMFGTRKYDTPDQSRNNIWIAILALGEGWHNDHHYQQGRAKQGIGWGKVDVSYYFLWLFKIASLGLLVWDLHKPAQKARVTPSLSH